MKIGMEHNPDVTEEQDVNHYVSRNIFKKKQAFKIIRDETVGRHMVASRNIKAGETILKEEPLTYGPNEITKPICLGTYQPVTVKTPRCKYCGFPLITTSKVHQEYECQAFQDHGYKVNASTFNFDGEEPTYSVISPIRTLKLREKNPELWKLVWMQMSHLSKRQESQFWKKKTEKIIGLMKTMIGLAEEDVPIVEAILGIHLVNDFEIGLQDRSVEDDQGRDHSIRGLFGLASMPNHDCVANTTHSFGNAEQGFVMTVKALRDINKGVDITHSYTEPLETVLARQTKLSMGKFFICGCKRCADPTELGTYSSCLKCPKCQAGNVISTDTSKIESSWKCQKCSESISVDKISKVTKAVKEASEKLDGNPKVEEYEKFLKKYSTVVHENHVFLIDKKYNLAKMYGRMAGYEVDQMSDDQLRRKRQLCEEVLKVLDQIMPGRSRKRGMMKYELHLPLVMLTNRNLQRGPTCGVNPEVLKSDLKLGLKHLKESLDILGDEPEGSFESKIVEGSKESVTQLQDWVNTVCNAL